MSVYLCSRDRAILNGGAYPNSLVGGSGAIATSKIEPSRQDSGGFHYSFGWGVGDND